MVKLQQLAQWRSGNAGVCKTSMQGFDSPLCLIKQILGQKSKGGGSPANGRRWRDFAEAQDSLAKRDPALQDLPRLKKQIPGLKNMSERERSFPETAVTEVVKYTGLMGGLMGLFSGEWLVGAAGAALALVAHLIGKKE